MRKRGFPHSGFVSVLISLLCNREEDIQLMSSQSIHREQRQCDLQLKTWPSDQRTDQRAQATHLYSTQQTASLSIDGHEAQFSSKITPCELSFYSSTMFVYNPLISMYRWVISQYLKSSQVNVQNLRGYLGVQSNKIVTSSDVIHG